MTQKLKSIIGQSGKSREDEEFKDERVGGEKEGGGRGWRKRNICEC